MNTRKKEKNSRRIAIRNYSVVTTGFLLVMVISMIITFGVFYWLSQKFPLPPDNELDLKVKYLEQYVNVGQAIAVGVTVTLASVIIPLILPEARDRFDRYKESRLAYSRAKTAVIYLPDRVANVDQNEAFLLVEEAHREIHFAETFEDMIIRQGYLDWFDSPKLWIPYNYWQIFAVAAALRKSDERVIRNKGIRKAVEVVHNIFGRTGEKCANKKWNPKTRDEEEKKLEKEIKATLETDE